MTLCGAQQSVRHQSVITVQGGKVNGVTVFLLTSFGGKTFARAKDKIKTSIFCEGKSDLEIKKKLFHWSAKWTFKITDFVFLESALADQLFHPGHFCLLLWA